MRGRHKDVDGDGQQESPKEQHHPIEKRTLHLTPYRRAPQIEYISWGPGWLLKLQGFFCQPGGDG
jgi:hypothetical protein